MNYEYFPKGTVIGFAGLGKTNMPLATLLRDSGFDIILRDRKSESPIEGFDCRFGEGYLDNITEDVLFLAPVLRPDIPEIVDAEKRGVYVTSDINEYYKRRKGKIIAITGSDGKTTTTTLIYELLKRSGKKVLLGGNIGFNLMCKLPDEDKDTYTVVEMSSFQLTKMKYAPDVAVITNISPNHLDWHTDMNEYIDAKKNIFKFMKSGVVVLNADDKTSMDFAGEVPVKTMFVSGERNDTDIHFDSDALYIGENKILAYDDILIPGRHNRYNYSEAIAATLGIADIGVIDELAKTFPGVKHRCQFIREVNGVKYYNSSIDSSPTRTAAALNSFKQKLIVICGGYDKHIPLEPLVPLFEKTAKAVITMGVTGPKIRELLNASDYGGIKETASSLTEAVQKAKNIAEKGDIVILSPAAASFDMFKNFEERGDAFADCVNAL